MKHHQVASSGNKELADTFSSYLLLVMMFAVVSVMDTFHYSTATVTYHQCNAMWRLIYQAL